MPTGHVLTPQPRAAAGLLPANGEAEDSSLQQAALMMTAPEHKCQANRAGRSDDLMSSAFSGVKVAVESSAAV